MLRVDSTFDYKWLTQDCQQACSQPTGTGQLNIDNDGEEIDKQLQLPDKTDKSNIHQGSLLSQQPEKQKMKSQNSPKKQIFKKANAYTKVARDIVKQFRRQQFKHRFELPIWKKVCKVFNDYKNRYKKKTKNFNSSLSELRELLFQQRIQQVRDQQVQEAMKVIAEEIISRIIIPDILTNTKIRSKNTRNYIEAIEDIRLRILNKTL